jgi:hypothetical protein
MLWRVGEQQQPRDSIALPATHTARAFCTRSLPSASK